MKKAGLLLIVVTAGLLISAQTQAQSKTDYFAGKWRLIIYGTPNGDAPMIFQLERKDGKLTGVVRDSTDKEMTKITSIEDKDTAITVYFTTQGYDVNVFLQPVPADSVKGNLMSMFDVKGVRLKEKKD